MAEPQVLSQPLAELAVPNAKYIKNCTELYLANKGITELDGFEPFTNLETLWINGNKLEFLDDLDGCMRLQHLYAQDNRLNTLDGSIPSLKHLRTLVLSNNALSNLEAVLAVLVNFPHLETLDLSDNPVAEEDRYRARVLKALPQLHSLDGLRVKATESAVAANVNAAGGQADGSSSSNSSAGGGRGGSAGSEGKGGKGRRNRPGEDATKQKKFQWKDNLSDTVKLAERENAQLAREQREREQRDKLAQFKNLEVLRAKSLTSAPVSQYAQQPTHKTQRIGGDRLSEWDLLRGEWVGCGGRRHAQSWLAPTFRRGCCGSGPRDSYLPRAAVPS
jgi:hypothetical protein